MDQIHHVLAAISDFLWGIPLMIALIGTGLYLTIILGFVQFRTTRLGVVVIRNHAIRAANRFVQQALESHDIAAARAVGPTVLAQHRAELDVPQVDVLVTEDGYYATWEQSQDDGSQPLVMNYVSASDAAALLSGTGRS